MRTALPAAAFFLCLGIVLLMTAADDAAQRKAEAQLAARIFTKFPDAHLAAFIQQDRPEQSHQNEKEQ